MLTCYNLTESQPRWTPQLAPSGFCGSKDADAYTTVRGDVTCGSCKCHLSY